MQNRWPAGGGGSPIYRPDVGHGRIGPPPLAVNTCQLSTVWKDSFISRVSRGNYLHKDQAEERVILLRPRPYRAEALSDDARLTSVCRVHRAKSRTERPRKIKIGTAVGHVTP